MNISKSTLYIVATPIGNLNDISHRAVETLQHVDIILAEDTRHSASLMSHFNIRTPMQSFHEHNETEKTKKILKYLAEGKSLALISDAGTPLISDPGYILVREVYRAGFDISPIPGPSAITAALCAAGLPTNRFLFCGFLPAKQSKRKQALSDLAHETATLVLYESSHRIVAMLEDMYIVFGDRTICLAREITKKFETIRPLLISQWLEKMANDPHQTKGEFVILIEGNTTVEADTTTLDKNQLYETLLSEELSTKQAANIAAKLLSIKKNAAYQEIQTIKDETKSQ